MNLTQIVDRALSGALSEGVDQAEAYTVKSRTISLYVEDSRVKNLEEKVDLGLAVRVADGPRLGEASSTIGSMDHVGACTSSAIKAARVSAPDPYFIGFAVGGDPTGTKPKVWDEDVASLDPETLSSKGMEIVQTCIANGDVKVPRGMIRAASIEVEVGNSNGMNPMNALFEIYDDAGELVLTSSDNLDGIEFPDCCTEIGPEWFSFSEAKFNIPETAAKEPGDYTLRFYMGLYGLESVFSTE